MLFLAILSACMFVASGAPTPSYDLDFDHSLLNTYHEPIILTPIIKTLAPAPIITHVPLIKYTEPIYSPAPIFRAAPIYKAVEPATLASYHIEHAPIVKVVLAAHPPILQTYAPSLAHGFH